MMTFIPTVLLLALLRAVTIYFAVKQLTFGPGTGQLNSST